MPRNTPFNDNYYFVYKNLSFLIFLMARAEAKSKTVYKGYIESPANTDYMLETDSSCTKNGFMKAVTKSTEDGGCDASKRSMDLSDFFGDYSCSMDWRGTTLTRYGSADEEFDDCSCDLLKKIDGDCDTAGWIIFGYCVAGVTGLAILGCVGYGLYKADVLDKTMNCLGSIKDSAVSLKDKAVALTDRCKRPEPQATDNPTVENGEHVADPKSSTSYNIGGNISAFFSRCLGRNSTVHETELKETITPS